MVEKMLPNLPIMALLAIAPVVMPREANKLSNFGYYTHREYASFMQVSQTKALLKLNNKLPYLESDILIYIKKC